MEITEQVKAILSEMNDLLDTMVKHNTAPRPDQVERIVEALGTISAVVSPESSTSSAAVGDSMRSALKIPLIKWQPMSPKAPVPKSHQPRHTKGW